jgi:hypothetical protein
MKRNSPLDSTLAIIMGGGAGTRLFPLTQKRAKPAVPLGGKYRPVDRAAAGGFGILHIGVRSVIGAGSRLAGVVMMGAIIDKNARIGAGVSISPAGKPANVDGPEGRYYIRDGVVVVPKGGHHPGGHPDLKYATALYQTLAYPPFATTGKGAGNAANLPLSFTA